MIMTKKEKKTSDLLHIKVKNDQIETALKIFKNRVKDSGLLLQLKENAHYIKPSVKRRSEKKLAALRYKKDSEQEYKKLY